MKDLKLKIQIKACQMEDLTTEDHDIVEKAIEATELSYAPYSQFHVGACLKLDNGIIIKGCNQENAAFPAGICAERTAIFAAGADYPDQPIKTLAIAARDKDGNLTDDPVSPCGTCRQVMIETEKRFGHPIHILLYGKRCVYIVDGIRNLMPLSFTEF
ncbi:MAG: cytidine deaminase [Prevotella sp.]|nr:cytidine deaminase [Prevotella sp.]